MEKRTETKVNGLPALLFWGLVWQAAAMAMGNPLLLPTPVLVLQRLWQLMAETVFWQITLASIGRVLLGVLLGVILGTLLAVLTSSSRLADMLLKEDFGDYFITNHPSTDWRVTLEHGEALGIGSREYELVEVK